MNSKLKRILRYRNLGSQLFDPTGKISAEIHSRNLMALCYWSLVMAFKIDRTLAALVPSIFRTRISLPGETLAVE